MPIQPDDPVLPLRRQLAAEIVRSLGPDSHYVIAPHYGIRQPRMSELSRGVVDRCGVEWLIRRIHRLGGSVMLTVSLGDTAREWRRMCFLRRRALNQLATRAKDPHEQPGAPGNSSPPASARTKPNTPPHTSADRQA